uniref:Uncharacterized protein n=1 Tax=Janibacter limosus TaxID=53458 RepID=A0AC61U1D9_9MICO|nr:hypothetical protein [Janibacter limosus]
MVRAPADVPARLPASPRRQRPHHPPDAPAATRADDRPDPLRLPRAPLRQAVGVHGARRQQDPRRPADVLPSGLARH